MEEKDVIQELLEEMNQINCAELECIYFCFRDDWPDCRRPETTIFNGYIKGYGIGECNCPFFKKNAVN